MRRKGTQRGSVQRRGDMWHVFFREYRVDADGNAKWLSTSRPVGPAAGPEKISKAEARERGFTEHVSKANGLTKTPGGSMTLQQFVESRYTPEVMERLRRNTLYTNHSLIRKHILPSFGHLQMRDISRAMVQSVISGKQRAGLSGSTVLHIRHLLNSILEHARRLNFISGELPTSDLILPEKQHAKRAPLTWQQVADLKGHLKEQRLRLLVDLLATLGLRIGEAAGLRWSCVNLGERVQYAQGDTIPPYSILVREQYTRNRFSRLKTNGSRAVLPLDSDLWVALADWYERTEYDKPEDTVFAGRNGSPLDAHNTAARMLKPAAMAAGIPWASWHHLRHTASTNADQTMTLREKMDLLRHTSVDVHMSYTKSDLDTMRRKLETMKASAMKH